VVCWIDAEQVLVQFGGARYISPLVVLRGKLERLLFMHDDSCMTSLSPRGALLGPQKTIISALRKCRPVERPLFLPELKLCRRKAAAASISIVSRSRSASKRALNGNSQVLQTFRCEDAAWQAAPKSRKGAAIVVGGMSMKIVASVPERAPARALLRDASRGL